MKTEQQHPTRLLVDARIIGGEGQGSVTYLKGIYNTIASDYSDEYELFFIGYDYAAISKAFKLKTPENFIPLKTKNKLRLLTIDIPRIINQYKIDFAHFQYITPLVKTCNFIVTVHDVLFNDFKTYFPKHYALKRNFLFKHSLKKSEVRLTVSKYSAKRIDAWYEIPENTLSITPNAVREEYFEDYDKQEIQKRIAAEFGTQNYILYVSRIEPRKNHTAIMKAYRELKLHEQGVELVFIGNDTLDSREEASEMAKMKKDFPKSFKHFSGISDEAVLNFYRAAELFIYPSLAEGFGIPPIEAAAAGVPVLCARETAMTDFDFFGENFFDPYNTEELKLKINNILNHSSAFEKTDDIRLKVKEKYNWRNAAEVLHHAIQKQIEPDYKKPEITKTPTCKYYEQSVGF